MNYTILTNNIYLIILYWFI